MARLVNPTRYDHPQAVPETDQNGRALWGEDLFDEMRYDRGRQRSGLISFLTKAADTAKHRVFW